MSVVVTLAVGLSLSLSAPSIALQEGVSTPRPRGLVRNELGACQGYTLLAPFNSRTVYLLDMQGEVAHRWVTSTSPAGGVYLLPNGHLLRLGRVEDAPRFHGGGIGGVIEELDRDGNVVWSYRQADDFRILHHDIEPLPNGNVLAIAWEHRYREDAIEWGRDPAQVGGEGLWPDAVLEIRPTPPEGGEIVWAWHSWDHLVQDLDPGRTNWGEVADRPERIDINADHRDRPPMTEAQRAEREELDRQMRALGYAGGDEQAAVPPAGCCLDPDWLHVNSVDYLPEQDLILLSAPNLGELWVIDHSTTTEEAAWTSGGRWGRGGDLLWRWGNPRNYGCGTDGDTRLFHQHDAQWLTDGTGSELRLLVFDNGCGRAEGDYSSVEELVLPFDPEKGFVREPGQAFGPTQPVWTYADGPAFYSSFLGGAQRLPGGNTLICSGVQGRVFEVTREGRVVWDLESPFGGDIPATESAGGAPTHALFRATRLLSTHPGLAGRLLGLPESLTAAGR